MPNLLRIPLVLFLAGSAFSQCGPPNYACSTTSLATLAYPTSPPNVGGITGAGNTFADPTFGTLGVRLTDANTDPALIGGINGLYSVSNGGSDDDNWWSTDDRLTLAGSSGGFKYLIAFNPSTFAVSRPYSAVTSGCPRGNCSTNGGWSIADSVNFSQKSACVLYDWHNATLLSYTFGSDVSPTNGCSGGISGPPVVATVENFIENSPTGCVGIACSCLPSDFGSPTWVGEGDTVAGDLIFSGGYSSSAYHNGAGTGQGSGFYAIVWSPTKGCISYNTSTGSIKADIGWAGGAGLTCSATQCTGSSTAGATFTLHNVHSNVNGSVISLSWTTCLSGACVADDNYAWITGTTTVYESEVTKTSGHDCLGALGIVNGPGSPSWQWYYRTLPVIGPPGNPVAVQTLPSPNQPTNLDAHCGWQMDNLADTVPFHWESTTASLLTSGLLPFDQPTGPWWSEIDLSETTGSGLTHREAMTFNTGYSINFGAANNITACSNDGLFCSAGSDWFNTLRNAAGNSTSCIPNGPHWKASTFYPLNYYLTPNGANNPGGNAFKVVTAGTSSSIQPNWATACLPGVCTDGGVIWSNTGVPTGANACAADVFVWKLDSGSNIRSVGRSGLMLN